MRDYFVYDGKKYNTGTVIYIKESNLYAGYDIEEEVVFLGYYDIQNKYVIMSKDGLCFISEENFYKKLICVTEKMNKNYINWAYKYNEKYVNEFKTFKDELNVDGMFVAWMWYIIVMVFALFMNDRIIAWIFASIVFFNYRKNKLKDGGV